jgi:hypothetical protein
MKKLFFLLLLIITTLFSKYKTDSMYVEENGNDENECMNITHACKTLNAAMKKSKVNGKIYVSTTIEYVRGFPKSLSLISTTNRTIIKNNIGYVYIHSLEGIELNFENFEFETNIAILCEAKVS